MTSRVISHEFTNNGGHGKRCLLQNSPFPENGQKTRLDAKLMEANGTKWARVEAMHSRGEGEERKGQQRSQVWREISKSAERER